MNNNNTNQDPTSRPSSALSIKSPTSPPVINAPTSDEIDAVIQMATSSRPSPDGRPMPLKDTRTQLFVGNVSVCFCIASLSLSSPFCSTLFVPRLRDICITRLLALSLPVLCCATFKRPARARARLICRHLATLLLLQSLHLHRSHTNPRRTRTPASPLHACPAPDRVIPPSYTLTTNDKHQHFDRSTSSHDLAFHSAKNL